MKLALKVAGRSRGHLDAQAGAHPDARSYLEGR